MKHFLPFALLGAVFLTACGGSVASAPSADLIKNPLYTKQYYDDLGQRMVDIIISEDDALKKDPALKTYIGNVKDEATRRSKEANTVIVKGLLGSFVPVKEQPQGHVLVTDSAVYLGADFITDPGPELHVYLTKNVDPRDGTFPGKNDLDLGRLKNPYSAQMYSLPTSQAGPYSTVVLYDTRLKRLYGFAQLAKQ